MIRNVLSAGLMLAMCGAADGQSAPPSFEVASIKPAPPPTDGRMMVSLGGDQGRVNYTNANLKQVLQRAYGVKSYQISGPSWLDSERYNIVATIPEGLSQDQVPVMLQGLLAERFKLKMHREKKDQSVYALVAGKGGPKLQKSTDEDLAPNFDLPVPAGGGPKKGGMIMIRNGHIEMKKMTMSGFADMLSNMLDRPVVDMTGIQGNYDVNLDVSMEDMVGMKGGLRIAHPGGGPGGPDGGGGPAGGPAPDGPPAPSIFTAIQQLGLKLDPRKAPIDYIVIDGGEKTPTEN